MAGDLEHRIRPRHLQMPPLSQSRQVYLGGPARSPRSRQNWAVQPSSLSFLEMDAANDEATLASPASERDAEAYRLDTSQVARER